MYHLEHKPGINLTEEQLNRIAEKAVETHHQFMEDHGIKPCNCFRVNLLDEMDKSADK